MSRRVLIIDSSTITRRIIADCLTDARWEVAAEVADGEEALTKYGQLRPDVVTLDIAMPDGLRLLDGILASDPAAEIILVSMMEQTRLISEGIRKGAKGFVAKPFLPEQLLDTLNDCSEKSAPDLNSPVSLG